VAIFVLTLPHFVLNLSKAFLYIGLSHVDIFHRRSKVFVTGKEHAAARRKPVLPSVKLGRK
jgi:hypothetical protein